MGKAKNQKICVFCGGSAKTRDHVPPKGIFPDPKPTDLITVPACASCNSKTKLDDEYFRWLVATGSGVDKRAHELIKDRILPRFRSRSALLHEIMKGATHVDIHSEGGIYLGKQPAFHFDRFRVQTVIDKTVRGLYYVELGTMLPENAVVTNFILNPIFEDEMKNVICSLPLKDIGNGIFSYRFWADDTMPEESFWLLMFFDKTLFLTKTEPNPSNSADATSRAAD